jgi:hypothetical protein
VLGLKGRTVRKWLRRAAASVGAGTLLGGGWTLFSWGYTHYWLPAQEAPTVNVVLDVDRAGQHENLAVLKGRVSLVNESQRRVQILASWYNIYGYRIKTQAATPDRAYQLAVDFSLSQIDRLPRPVMPRYYVEDDVRIVEAGRLFAEFRSYWLDPKERALQHVVWYIPRTVHLVRTVISIRLAKVADDVATCWHVDDRVWPGAIFATSRLRNESQYRVWPVAMFAKSASDSPETCRSTDRDLLRWATDEDKRHAASVGLAQVVQSFELPILEADGTKPGAAP